MPAEGSPGPRLREQGRADGPERESPGLSGVDATQQRLQQPVGHLRPEPLVEQQTDRYVVGQRRSGQRRLAAGPCQPGRCEQSGQRLEVGRHPQCRGRQLDGTAVHVHLGLGVGRMHQQVVESELVDQRRRLRPPDQHRLRTAVHLQVPEPDARDLAAEPRRRLHQQHRQPARATADGPRPGPRSRRRPRRRRSRPRGDGHPRAARRRSAPSSCTRSTMRCSTAGSVSGGTP